MTGKKLGACVCANAKPIAKERGLAQNVKAVRETGKESGYEVAGNSLFARFCHLVKTRRDHAEAFLENRGPANPKSQDQYDYKHLTEAVDQVRPKHDHYQQRSYHHCACGHDRAASGDGDANGERDASCRKQPALVHALFYYTPARDPARE